MKRVGNLYEQICSIENLRIADQKARKGKTGDYGVRMHDRNSESNLLLLHEALINKTYRTSEYTTFIVHEPKEREVYRLPYYPDRIVHHAIMNVLEPIFVASFTADTYSCIKGKGIHACSNGIKKALKDVQGTTYCLKIDIKKFYPNVDHDVLKGLLRRKFKDADLLWLLDEIIDSAAGLPIGNYLSQYLANFILSGFDHWVKEELRMPYYFRYSDDMAFPFRCKKRLHGVLHLVRMYLKELKLEIKDNYQIFRISDRGLNMVGYVHFHFVTFLRKSIKVRFAKMLSKCHSLSSIWGYFGWAKHCNSRHLIKKLLWNKQSLVSLT